MPASDGGLLGAHRPRWPARGVALAVGVLLCVALIGAWRAGQGVDGEGAVRVVLLSKAHDAHEKHARAKHALKKVGNKYRQELATVEKGAGNDRSDEMKQIEELQRRSEGGGGGSRTKGKGGKHLPPGLAEMQRLTHGKSKDDGLGALARQHGIKSSKNYMAEIMALRHYKKSSTEIGDIANGFEAHSSLSHKVRSSINRANAHRENALSSEGKRGAAAAILLETGRVSRGHMLRETVRKTEANVGRVLVKTFRPLQGVLRGDEKRLDRMMEQRHTLQAADDEAHRLNRELRAKMRDEVSAVINAEEVAQEHQSHKYLAKVHAKAKKALTKVVDPDTVAYKPPSAAPNSKPAEAWTGGSHAWTDKVQKFLDKTEKYMKTHIESAATEAEEVLATPSAAHKVGEDTVIAVTQHQLERELDSAQRAAKVRKEGSRGRLSSKQRTDS